MTTHRDELAAEVRELGGRLTSAVADLHGLVINDCLTTETLTLDGAGMATRDWTVPYGSVSVHNGGQNTVTITNNTAAAGAPQTGAGVVLVPPGAAVTANLSGRSLSLYGDPGTQLVVSVFTRPQPPAWGRVGSPVTALNSAAALVSVVPRQVHTGGGDSFSPVLTPPPGVDRARIYLKVYAVTGATPKAAPVFFETSDELGRVNLGSGPALTAPGLSVFDVTTSMLAEQYQVNIYCGGTGATDTLDCEAFIRFGPRTALSGR